MAKKLRPTVPTGPFIERVLPLLEIKTSTWHSLFVEVDRAAGDRKKSRLSLFENDKREDSLEIDAETVPNLILALQRAQEILNTGETSSLPLFAADGGSEGEASDPEAEGDA